jgi:hypothetical protein
MKKILLMFYHNNHKKGKEHFFSLEHSPMVLPRVGEEVYYFYVEKRAKLKNLNLKNPYGEVTEVKHRYIKSDEELADKDHRNISEIVIVKIQMS